LLRNSRGVDTGTVEVFRDISERIKNEQTIRDLAFLDPLTGLSNRRLFEDRLEQAIAKSRRYDMQFGLLTLDLDHFKEINDTFGHEAGDQVLQEAADRIRACCKRDLDTISRLGGDEFSIIFTDCEGKEQLSAIAENLLEQFARPFQLTGTLADVTTSIGISMFPDNGSRAKALEIASDKAMYAAKRAGRNTYMFSNPEVQS
jgi:diguanylate cyclase (GGDEF)-like protein